MSKDIKEMATTKQASKLFSSKVEPEAYNHIATKSELLAVQLISNDFNVSPSFFSEHSDIKIDLCHNILNIDLYGSNEMVAGIFRYEVIAKLKRKHVMTAKADFLAVYDLPENAAENESKAFCARVGLFAAYPYFRAIFSHLASSANVEIPILPVLSADPLRRRAGKQSTHVIKEESVK